MQTIVDVNFDRSEMLLKIANGNFVVSQSIPSDKIDRIQFGEAAVKSWFFNKKAPKIDIFIKGKEEPYTLQSGRSKLKFHEAEFLIRQFAERYGIPLET